MACQGRILVVANLLIVPVQAPGSYDRKQCKSIIVKVSQQRSCLEKPTFIGVSTGRNGGVSSEHASFGGRLVEAQWKAEASVTPGHKA